jgi:hypothetical protein
MNTAQVIPFTNNAPEISVPSIGTSSMLVELSISCWTGKKLDKKASNEVTDNKNAKRGVANVNKKLLGDCPELEAVIKFAANVRTASYASTMPWSDSGLRILPSAAFFTYQNEMTTLQAEFWRLVEAFVQAYDWEVGQAELRLGELFKRGEYPSSESVREKFGFRVNYIPLPDAGDWRVDVGNEAKATLTKHYSEYYRTQLEGAMRSVWERVYDALKRMSDRLDYLGDTDKKVFRDSLVDNVLDMINLLETCNITNDATMKSAADMLRNAMFNVTPAALREDNVLRRQTKARVDAIIATLPGLGM